MHTLVIHVQSSLLLHQSLHSSSGGAKNEPGEGRCQSDEFDLEDCEQVNEMNGQDEFVVSITNGRQ
jgi:hypothetical protein